MGLLGGACEGEGGWSGGGDSISLESGSEWKKNIGGPLL